MIQDYFKIAYKNLWKKKTRSSLTIIGIFLAILTIFVLVSLSLGLKDYVDEQFELLGTDKFFIQPKGSSGGLGLPGGAVELSIDDAEIVEKVGGVDGATYLSFENGKIEFKEDPARYYFVIGIPNDDEKKEELFFEAVNLDVDEGRMLKEGDRKKILIGYNYKHRDLFSNPIVSGNKLKINNVEFEVVGVLEAIGNPQDDQQVYIPLEDLREIFGTGNRVDLIWVQIEKGADIEEIAERTEKKLKKFRDVDDKTIDFSVETPKEMVAIFNNILNILLAFLIGIGSISVIVGGIGIANTMYTSVLERNKEIGTMKAIGAKNSDILLIFVIESGILGLVGGGLGLLTGIIIAKSIEYVSAVLIGSDIIRASMNPYLLVGVLLFAFFIGIVSGLTPSYQASKLKPVDALRYE
jgi:putative ABC transport system permease protein